MTITDEHIPGTAAPGTAPRGPLTLSYARGLEERRALEAHHRRLELARAAAWALGVALTLGLVVGLTAAWQIDRWLVDWHYSAQQDRYVLPEGEDQPSAWAPGEGA